MRLLKKTRKLCAAFSILELVACAQKPIVTKFDAAWEFCSNTPYEVLACLKEDDVKALRATLIECQRGK